MTDRIESDMADMIDMPEDKAGKSRKKADAEMPLISVGTPEASSIIENLPARLNIISPDLPKLVYTERSLWSMAAEIAREDDVVRSIDWLGIGPDLASALKIAGPNALGKLNEYAVCSFRAVIPETRFHEAFAYPRPWQTIHSHLRYHYFCARFASTYWLAVRDFAIKCKLDCLSVFHLPTSIIEALAESNSSQVNDFCNGYPELQSFSLTCTDADCIQILKSCNESAMDSEWPSPFLTCARLLKSNHCANYFPASLNGAEECGIGRCFAEVR